MSRNLQSNYYKRKVKDATPRQFWKIVYTLTDSNKKSTDSIQRLADSVCDGDLQDLACQVNTFFLSISIDLPPITPPEPNPVPIPDKYIIRVEDVEKQLMKTKLHKAPGPDGIPNWILRDFAPILAGPIASIVNSSVQDAYVPSMWRSADVIPLPKVSLPQKIEKDLRPVSLTPSISKSCMEHFVYKWLWDCVKDHLHPDQFGGIKGSSTNYALIRMLHDWFNSTDKLSTLVDVVLIDYQKAYDHLNHSLILQKLAKMDVPPFLANWIAAFLQNRQQRVKMGLIVSPWLEIRGGVPQGTKLASLLFLIMINDLLPINTTIK
jgi:hypothetical protein